MHLVTIVGRHRQALDALEANLLKKKKTKHTSQ